MFTVQMPNHFDSIFNKTWASSNYRLFSQEWNPWGDADIGRLQVMRFNLARACAVYDSDMQRMYWNQLTFEDQLFAEAQFDYFKRMHDEYAAREVEAIGIKHLQADLETLEGKWQSMGEATHLARESLPKNITYEDWMRGMLSFDAMTTLSPQSIPFVYHFENSLLKPGSFDVEKLKINAQGNRAKMYSTWRNQQGFTQHSLNVAINLWAYELVSRFPYNQIKGVSAKTHVLLTNSGIPLPNKATFLAWYAMCGFGCQFLAPADRKILTRLCGFTPRILLTYLIPMIPRTKEHGLRTIVGTDDSHADHSLPARSSGHMRDEYGRIKYGVWRVRSVLIGNDDGTIRSHIVANDDFSTAEQTGFGFHFRAMQMIPWTPKTGMMHSALFNSPMLGEVRTHMMDPYQANRDPLPLTMFATRNADLGMRAISKQQGIHFRFDEPEAAEDWCKAFEMCAYHQVLMNQDRQNKVFFEAVMNLSVIPTTVNDGRRFNLDSLEGAL